MLTEWPCDQALTASAWQTDDPSGPSTLNRYRMPERGARIARREERACWAQGSDEQRREAGCPARQTVVIQRGRATSAHYADSPDTAAEWPAVIRRYSHARAACHSRVTVERDSINMAAMSLSERPAKYLSSTIWA